MQDTTDNCHRMSNAGHMKTENADVDCEQQESPGTTTHGQEIIRMGDTQINQTIG
jgi:hypothetical protein